MQRSPIITSIIILLVALVAAPAVALAQGQTDGSNDASDGRQLVLGAVTLRDPQAGDIESHTLLLPEGWTLEGGPTWSPQTFRSFAHLDLRASGPDGLGISVYPGMMYSHLEADLMPPIQPGGVDNGTIFMPVPGTVMDYITEILLPQHRPGAQDVRIVDVAERPETYRMLEVITEPVFESVRQNDAFTGSQSEFQIVASQVRIAYTEDGAEYEEDLYLQGSVQQTLTSEFGLGDILRSLWWIDDVSSVRAIAGTLDDAKPLLEPLRLSIRQTPEHAALITELHQRILRSEADSLRRAGEIWRDNQQEIIDIHAEAVASRQAASDEANHDFLNYIRETEDYEDLDGSRVTLPAYYDRVLSNGEGGYILTDDHLYEEAGYRDLQVDP